MHHGARGAAHGFDGALYQVRASLRQHHDGHVVRDAVFLDQHPHEIEIGLRGRGERHLDLLEPDLEQLLEEAELALRVHRLDQGLVAIAQIRAHPDRRARDALGGPGSVGDIYGGGRAVFGGGVAQHHDGSPSSREDARQETRHKTQDRQGVETLKSEGVRRLMRKKGGARLPNCH